MPTKYLSTPYHNPRTNKLMADTQTPIEVLSTLHEMSKVQVGDEVFFVRTVSLLDEPLAQEVAAFVSEVNPTRITPKQQKEIDLARELGVKID